VRAPFEKEAPPKDPARLAIIGVGLSVTLIGLAAGAFYVFGGGTAATSPQANSSFEVVETPATGEAPATTETPTAPPPVASGQASAWRVDPARSSIGYAFNLDDGAGGVSRIEGRFGRWQADIRFDPNDLSNSAVAVTIETGSATNGIAAHDAAMREPGWFNSAAQPTATFRATEFRRRGDGYEARGELRIKDRDRDVELPFTLTINGDSATMNGTITLDREDFDLGDGVEGEEMVSRNVDVTIRVQATRAP
jgi:polyisoprenoid-binding protein YceI